MIEKAFVVLAAEYGMIDMKRFLKNKAGQRAQFRFEVFWHPYADEAMRVLNRDGVPELLRWPMLPTFGGGTAPRDFRRDGFAEYHADGGSVPEPTKPEDLDFSRERRTPYSQYNWELFFHVPFAIAETLMRNRRHREAHTWLSVLYDPTDQSPFPAHAKVWRMRALYDYALSVLGKPPRLEELMDSAAELTAETAVWMDEPFSPYAVAEVRLSALQKAVVMRMLDNLIAWADGLFRQDTLEAINEATHLYVLAAQILGPRPELIPPVARPSDRLTFNQVHAAQGAFDDLSNKKVEIENLLAGSGAPLTSDVTEMELVTTLADHTRFFAVPPNEKLLGYWDTLADRLYKIRHSLDLAGIARQLPLFEPPLDPGLLARAAAAGVDLAQVVSDANAPAPHHRFSVLLAKARELSTEVKQLGGLLLTTLEKRDGEEMAGLRAGHELTVLALVKENKRRAIDEAQKSVEAQRAYELVVAERETYYSSRPRVIPGEVEQLSRMSLGVSLTEAQLSLEVLIGILHLIPAIELGSPFTMGATTGGEHFGQALQAFASSLGLGASITNSQGSMMGILAGYERRADDWTHQATLARKEKVQAAKQTLAAEIRLAMAEHELAVQERQIEQSKEAAELLATKFTNHELYDWMAGQVSALYFQSYQLAYELAKRAELAFRRERGDASASFVQYGHFEGLRQGLLAGERLAFDLSRMEVAYLDQDQRTLELTKHVSLARLDPVALIALRESGQCFFSLPEALYDADYPGQFDRVLRDVSVSIPCITGPHQGVQGTLTLLWHAVRREAKAGPLVGQTAQGQALATSSGMNDSGCFDADRAEDKYRRFEHHGAVGDWRLEIPRDTNAFDRRTLTDVILHLRYQARDGGQAFANAVRGAGGLAAWTAVAPSSSPAATTVPRTRFLSSASAFPDAWAAFRAQPLGPDGPTLEIDLRERLPAPPAGKEVQITAIRVFLLARPRPSTAIASGAVEIAVAKPKGTFGTAAGLTTDPTLANLPAHRFAQTGPVAGPAGEPWRLKLTTLPAALARASDATHIDADVLDDLGLLVSYDFV